MQRPNDPRPQAGLIDGLVSRVITALVAARSVRRGGQQMRISTGQNTRTSVAGSESEDTLKRGAGGAADDRSSRDALPRRLVMRTRSRVASLVATSILALAVTPTPARSIQVHSSWQQLINCAPTSYDPFTKKLSCGGSTYWKGTWTGITSYRVSGTVDLLTGDALGTIRETFVGRADDGSVGTLEFRERFWLTGATKRFDLEATIVRSTGGFAGSNGRATFDGTDNLITGSGTYAGHWTQPSSHTTRRGRGIHALSSTPRHHTAITGRTP